MAHSTINKQLISPVTRRRIKNKAREVVSRHTAHGTEKSNAKQLCVIASIGTERNYRQRIDNYLSWCELNAVPPDYQGCKKMLSAYLEERAEWVQQKTLNQERQALEQIFKQKINAIKSKQVSVYEKRSYLPVQAQIIIKHQTEKNAVTSLLALFSGIRAHEAATIRQVSEQRPSQHRTWDSRRFLGLKSFVIYTVVGKGGLIREIAVPHWLAKKLEGRRRNPVVVSDREIKYLSYYDIGIGQAWSQSFSSLSYKYLGYSTGGHGLRHSFAKWRLNQLLDILSDLHNTESVETIALQLLSQSLGHFRLDIVHAYLR